MRRDEFTRDHFKVLAEQWLDAAVKGEDMNFTPRDGWLAVNSSIKFDYSDVSFGLEKAQSHFLHTITESPRYIKMFQRNAPLHGGAWGKGVEISFSLQPAYMEPFVQKFREEGKRWGIEEEIEVWYGGES
ncbi:hypothetical protein BT69DRAFT_1219480 [Atractiella rhizophila]|nr:hypothetical protein BT69DRAFT_1219480 [Atractiella rhizophila]